MRIIKHINGMYDVFSAQQGWDIHTRIQLARGPKGTIMQHISGQRLPQAVAKVLLKSINHKLHYQTVEA